MPEEKLTLFMESTKKDPEVTISEIQKLLKKLGIRDMLINYDKEGEVEAVSFTIEKKSKRIPFRLPVDHKPLWKLAQQGKTKYIRDEKQARRVAWRQIYRWIEAQTALIYTEMVTIEEVFLPYILINEKQTVYEKILASGLDGHLLIEEK